LQRKVVVVEVERHWRLVTAAGERKSYYGRTMEEGSPWTDLEKVGASSRPSVWLDWREL
jgi:hypothetical protein